MKKNIIYKYFYIIQVIFLLNEKEFKIIKFGITSDYNKRFKQYRNNNSGKIEKVYYLWRCNQPKKLEYLLKWYLRIEKQIPSFINDEYYESDYFEEIIDSLEEISKLFTRISLKKIDYEFVRKT